MVIALVKCVIALSPGVNEFAPLPDNWLATHKFELLRGEDLPVCPKERREMPLIYISHRSSGARVTPQAPLTQRMIR